jgi:hypothetical protein
MHFTPSPVAPALNASVVSPVVATSASAAVAQ